MMQRILFYVIAALFTLLILVTGLWRLEHTRAISAEAKLKTVTIERDFFKDQMQGAADRAAARTTKADEEYNKDVQTVQKAPRDANGNITCDAKCLRDRFGR